MSKTGLKEKLRYRFDNTMSKGTVAIIGWLALLSLALVVVAGAILFLTGISPEGEGEVGFIEGIWKSLMRTLDPGTMGGDAGWGFRIIMFMVTLGGIFIISTLIGIISSGIDQLIENLRKGKSNVLESNHTLILGYSFKIYAIISELCIANENQKNPRIVILTDRDKVELEDDIKAKIPNTKNTKVIVRNGSPLDLNDIEVVNPNEARSIIVLSPENQENADTYVIKSVLAITNNKNRKKSKYHIVAEIKDPKNLEAAHLVGGDEAVYVMSSDLISRITAQTCRQSGLSIIYSEIMQFEGDEIYFQEEPTLIGKTYKESLFAYEDSSVIGIFTKDEQTLINPEMDYVIQEGDQIIAISEDDDTVIVSKNVDSTPDLSIESTKGEDDPHIERNVIIGWNKKGIRIVEELDNYVLKGSEVLVLADTKEVEEDMNILKEGLQNITISLIIGDINSKNTLEMIGLENYDHIILLSYIDDLDTQESDARTLITLLHLRNISRKTGKKLLIVSEMLDIRNRQLAEVAEADDFIVSDNLISLILTQLSENKHLEKVYNILFESEGSELYLKDVEQYVKTGVEMNFYSVVECATHKNDTAIGYRQMKYENDSDRMYGVKINPKKSEMCVFEPKDKLIVLSED